MANNKKLIRLSTSSDSAEWDTQFDDGILISPNMEISLRGLSFDRSDPTILINGENNLITFQAKEGSVHEIYLPTGTFSSSNITALFRQFQNLMNGESLLSNNKEFGLQYYVGVNQTNKFELRAIQNEYLNSANDDNHREHEYWNFKANMKTEDPANLPSPLVQTVGRQDTIGDFNNSYTYHEHPFTKGCGVFRLRIEEMVQPGTAGTFVMGLCNDITKLQNGTITVDSMEIAIECVSETAAYRVRTSTTQLGAFEPVTNYIGNVTNETPAARNRFTADVDDHDVLEISLENDTLSARIHTTAGFSNFISIPYVRSSTSSGKDLYPFVCLYKPLNTIKVDQVACNWDTSYDDYYNPLSTNKRETNNLSVLPFPRGLSAPHATMDESSNGVSIWKLESNSLEVSRFFGWSHDVFGTNLANPFIDPVPDRHEQTLYNTIAPQQRNLYFPHLFDASKSDGVSGDKMVCVLSSNVYLVEMLNIKLDSYDSFNSKRGRANILAVINSNEFNTGNLDRVLMYEPNDPIYISMMNAQELSLRNIRCRIVNLDYSPVMTVGTSTITLHLRPYDRYEK